MAQQRLGIIMNGVTGRMGMNQHLIRSILAIRAQGGVALKNGDRVMPDPILVGRSEAKLAQLAKAHGLTRWTSDLNAALKNREDTLFFDAATTNLRAQLLRKAIAAGKDIYCEKPIAETLTDVLDNLFGEVKSVSCLGATHIPQALGRERQALQGRRGRRRLRHLPARGRRRRPHQQLLVHTRATRRSRYLPRRRHFGLGGRGPAEMLEPGAGEHAAAGVEPRRPATDQILRDLERGAGRYL